MIRPISPWNKMGSRMHDHSTHNSVIGPRLWIWSTRDLERRRAVENAGVRDEMHEEKRADRHKSRQRVQPADDEFVTSEDRGDVGHVREDSSSSAHTGHTILPNCSVSFMFSE